VDRTALIGVPTSAGTHGPGQERAPFAPRRAGLVPGLEAAGIVVHDEGDLPLDMYRAAVPDPRQRDLDGVVRVADRERLGVHGEQGPERFDLALAKVAGHDLAHLNQLARTVAAVSG
jgi:arginase